MGSFKAKGYYFAIIILVIAALCQSLTMPFSTLLLQDASPFMAAGFMSLGALIWGVISFGLEKKSVKKATKRNLAELPTDRKFQRKDYLWLGILTAVSFLADCLIMFGLTMCQASSAALITNFNIVMTAVIALIFLKEKIKKRLWIAIVLITLGGITISAGGSFSSLAASPGLILIFGSCICFGIFYCCMKKLSGINPGKIIIIYQSITIVCEFILAFVTGEQLPGLKTVILLMLLGMVVYGIANYFILIATRTLGVAKCSSVLGLAPFIGAGLSLIIFQEQPTLAFFVSFILLIPGFYLVIRDKEDKERMEMNDSPPPIVEEYHDVRNYLTAFGLLTVFAVEAIFTLINIYYIVSGEILVLTSIAGASIAIAQIVTGCILIILKHRNFTGMTMLLFGFTTILIVSGGEASYLLFAIIGILEVILAGIVLFLKEKKKYCYCLLYLLLGISSIFYAVLEDPTVSTIINSVVCIYLFIMIIGASGVLQKFPLTKILAEDETLEFDKVGTAIGYLIVAMSIIPWMCLYLFGTEVISLEFAGNFSIGCGIMIGILAVLLLFVAKNRFMSVVFLGIMLSLLLGGSTMELTNYIAGFVMLLTGLFCLMRKKSYLLVALMCILYGIAQFASIVIHGEAVLLISQFLMHSITLLLAVYLAVAVFSQNRKLPMF